jgi:hAT family C-terminal dimerisation region
MDAEISIIKGEEYSLKFDEKAIEKFYDDAINYVVALLSNKIKYVPKETSTSIEENIDGKNDLVAGNLESEDEDEQRNKLHLKLKLLQFKKQTNQGHKTQQLLHDELVANITKQMNKYKEECFDLDLNDYVDKYKNDQYDIITKNGTNINYDKINIKMDLAYITKLTSVANYWKLNNDKYEDLSIAACIVLGKPTHNAFQERVFSRGSYADTALKKRLTETSFEMSVLNAVNVSSIDMLKEQIEVINKSYEEDIAASKLNTIKYERVQEYYNKMKAQRELQLGLLGSDVINEKDTSNDESEEVSVAVYEEDDTSFGDLSDDNSISNYFEEYELNKQINDLNELKEQQKIGIASNVDNDGDDGNDDMDDGDKKQKAIENYNILGGILGSIGNNNNDNLSSSSEDDNLKKQLSTKKRNPTLESV